MTINTNPAATSAARNLNRSQEMLNKSLSRLSSGSKIVSPSDDAAGLAVSEKLQAQNRRLDAAATNVQNAMSYIQTADGFMSSMSKVHNSRRPLEYRNWVNAVRATIFQILDKSA